MNFIKICDTFIICYDQAFNSNFNSQFNALLLHTILTVDKLKMTLENSISCKMIKLKGKKWKINGKRIWTPSINECCIYCLRKSNRERETEKLTYFNNFLFLKLQSKGSWNKMISGYNSLVPWEHLKHNMEKITFKNECIMRLFTFLTPHTNMWGKY